MLLSLLRRGSADGAGGGAPWEHNGASYTDSLDDQSVKNSGWELYGRGDFRGKGVE